MKMWFYFRILVFLIDLHSELNCSAQRTCASDEEPSLNSVDDRSVIISPSPTYSNVTVIDKIEYWHINYLGCAKNESAGTVLTATSNIIDYLELYSQYGIVISYSIDQLKCTMETTFNTTESATLSSEEKPQITYSYTGIEAHVSIKWECQQMRGPISRSIEIRITCYAYSIPYVKNETMATTDLSFPATQDTSYWLKLNYRRGKDSRSEGHEIHIPTIRPREVRNVVAYNVNGTSISIRWLPPDSLTGEIELYAIIYYHDYKEATKTQVNASSNCKIWPTYICATINGNMFLNTEYYFEIWAKYREFDEFGDYSFFISPTNRERVPSKPLNVNYIWNKEILTINWQHPDVPYGRILEFLIQINKRILLTYNVTEERLNYDYKINVRGYNFISKKLIIEIAAVNGMGNSSYAVNSPKSYFSEVPALENITHSTYGVKFPPVYEVEGDISKLIENKAFTRNISQDDHSDAFSYLWSLIIVPVLMGVFSAIIIIRRRRNKYFGLCKNYDDVMNIYTLPLRPRIKDDINIYDKIIQDDRDFLKLVKIQELDQYIKDGIESEKLARQYNLLPQGPMKLHYDGSQLPNRAKNRHHDLVAYDDTRVKLDIVDGDPFSDYINANYIDGYNSQKTYIATQTPMDNTYSDFWRMIWQENVKYIIIAADLNDEEKQKGSGIYWPDINEEADYDNIKVVYRNIEVMANYEIRHFSIFYEHQERLIEQLHFFSTPEYSRVPLYIHSLASFMKKILSISEERSPIVVHCSDGISYTGIVILCDICLRMAISEGQMDIFSQLYKLRRQRMNMVSSVEIYKVIHFVLLRILECLKIPTATSITCDRTMERTIENILTTKIVQQMKYLEETSWQDKAMRDIDFLYDSIRSDWIPDSEPTDSQVYRYSTIGNASIYITTTIVDSFTTPSKFVVTPKPLNATLGVFWQFIFTKRINVVLCLNKLSLIADLKETFNPCPGLDVKCYNQSIGDHFKVYTLHANECNNQTDKLEINIIHVLEWPSDSLHPEHPNNLIMAYEEMNRLGKTGRPILITCHDGVNASGLFVAMCFLIEKIRLEHVCDVCLAVKSVQQSRKQYVRKAEQYTFLYLCALEYVRKFKMYSNFDSSMNDA